MGAQSSFTVDCVVTASFLINAVFQIHCVCHTTVILRLGHYNMPQRRAFEILTGASLCGFPGWGFAIGTEFQIHSWRLFILVCLFPALAALIGIIFMPESPRFLLEVRRWNRLETLKLVYTCAVC